MIIRIFCQVEEQTATQEDKAQGSITMASYYRYFRAGANCFVLFIVLLIFIMGEVSIECCKLCEDSVVTCMECTVLHIQGSIIAADWWLVDWYVCMSLLPIISITDLDAIKLLTELNNMP